MCDVIMAMAMHVSSNLGGRQNKWEAVNYTHNYNYYDKRKCVPKPPQKQTRETEKEVESEKEQR